MLDEIYKEYGDGYFYVPMTQGYNIGVPIWVGCRLGVNAYIVI